MKRQFSFLWVAFVLVAALPCCSPNIASAPTSGSALVKVECRDASDVREMVLQLLRSGRGKDISVKTDGACLEITAAFSPADTPPGRLVQVMEDLNNLGGVLHVEVVENPRPILRDFTPWK